MQCRTGRVLLSRQLTWPLHLKLELSTEGNLMGLLVAIQIFLSQPSFSFLLHEWMIMQ